MKFDFSILIYRLKQDAAPIPYGASFESENEVDGAAIFLIHFLHFLKEDRRVTSVMREDVKIIEHEFDYFQYEAGPYTRKFLIPLLVDSGVAYVKVSRTDLERSDAPAPELLTEAAPVVVAPIEVKTPPVRKRGGTTSSALG